MTSTPLAAPIGGAVPLRAWAGWLLASMFFFYAFALRVAPSVMVEELMRDFSVGAAILGNLSAVYFYAYASLQIPVGVMLDRLGPRRLMTGGAVAAALGALLFAWADTLALAYAGRFLIGAGAAFSWVGALTVAIQWFPPHRFAALAGGSQAFGMLGAVVGQAPLGYVVDIHGWRTGMLMLGAFGVLLALSIFTIARDRVGASQSAGTTIMAGLRIAMGNRQTWLCAVFGMAMVCPMVAFAGLWAVPYLTQAHGLDRATAATLTSLMFIAWGVGAPVLGGISDRLGKRRAMMVWGAGTALLCFVAMQLLHGVPLWLLALPMMLSGFAASAMIVAVALARESNPAQVSGTVLGLVNTFVVGSGALFQPLIGYLLDLQWDGAMTGGARLYSAAAYDWALSVLPLGCAVAVVMGLLSRDVPRERAMA